MTYGTDKVKWGVLGTAQIARNMVIPGMMNTPNCDLVAIAGRSEQKVQSFADEFDIPRTYTSYEQLLDDPDIQAVYIPLPNDLHEEWTIRSLKAKKNVLCEKPLAADAESARRMFDAAAANGVLLMEGFAYLHSPYMSSLRMLIKNGEIGKITYVQSEFMTRGYDETNIRMQKDHLGGALYDLGCYNTSQLLWLLNRDPRELKGRAIFDRSGVDILTQALLEFDDESYGAIRCGFVLGRSEQSRLDAFEIRGTKGFIRSNVPFNESDALEFLLVRGDKASTVRVFAQQNYSLEVEQFGRCILFGEEPLVSAEFSIRNAALLDRVRDAITE